MQRREFLASATTLGALTVVEGSAPLRRMEGPAIIRQRAAKPIIVSSSNGGWFKNGGPKTAVELAYEKITQGTDVLDALVAGVNIDELDPDEMYVGYGGPGGYVGVGGNTNCGRIKWREVKEPEPTRVRFVRVNEAGEELGPAQYRTLVKP